MAVARAIVQSQGSSHRSMFRPKAGLGVLWVLAAVTGACRGDAADPRDGEWGKRARLDARPKPAHPADALIRERSGAGRARYLGYDLHPAGPYRPGDVVDVTHYLEVEASFSGDYLVFVHGDRPGDGHRWFAADHHPIGGKVPTRFWKKGDIYKDAHRVRIPREAKGDSIELFVGMFAGDQRLTVQAKPGGSDGQDRIKAGRLRLSGTPGEGATDDLPSVTIPRASRPIVADGVLEEAAWSTAPVLSMSDTMGRGVPTQYPTKLRLLYDDDNLYVAFDATDVDITCPYEKRDDPIYDHETVELFLMPNVRAPALGPYVELQASPKGVIFDAAFIARRKGMDKSFDAGQKVGTKVRGTLNVEDGRDDGWVSEWVVPWKGIRGIDAPPKPGDEWRMNAFRIEKYRSGGRLQGEYTAWSPPRVGDFHNVDRFGRMKFGS